MGDINQEIIFSGMLIDGTTTFSFSQVCQKYNVSEVVLTEMVEHGLFEPETSPNGNLYICRKSMCRIESALRIQRDLGINLPGAVLALELFDKLMQIHMELDYLRK